MYEALGLIPSTAKKRGRSKKKGSTHRKRGEGESNRSLPSGREDSSLNADVFRPQHTGRPEELGTNKKALFLQAVVMDLSRSCLEWSMPVPLALDPAVPSGKLMKCFLVVGSF